MIGTMNPIAVDRNSLNEMNLNHSRNRSRRKPKDEYHIKDEHKDDILVTMTLREYEKLMAIFMEVHGMIKYNSVFHSLASWEEFYMWTVETKKNSIREWLGLGTKPKDIMQ